MKQFLVILYLLLQDDLLGFSQIYRFFLSTNAKCGEMYYIISRKSILTKLALELGCIYPG